MAHFLHSIAQLSRRSVGVLLVLGVSACGSVEQASLDQTLAESSVDSSDTDEGILSGVPVQSCSDPVNDNNPCTLDRCIKGQVIHASVKDGTACNDGAVCTVLDKCSTGLCVGEPKYCATDSSNPSDVVDSTNPTDPINPTDPVDPVDPTNPSDPTDPVNPTDPVDPTNPLPPVLPSGKLSAVWVNDGGDKVARGELRASLAADAVKNSVWDPDAHGAGTIRVTGAKNEVVSFNVVLEAAAQTVPSVSVKLAALTGPNGAKITSAPAVGDQVFNWVGRNIELFYVRYLQIKGLSYFGYPLYDERHIPERLQRPWYMDAHIAVGQGGWADRPDHDAFYPDIAVPIELHSTFTIAHNTNQSIWADIYIPKNAPAGVYNGLIEISESGTLVRQIPVELMVRNFALPDAPGAKTMLMLGYGDINERYLGLDKRFPNDGPDDDASDLIRDRHFQMAHRHKISLIDNNDSAEAWNNDAPRPEWLPRLDGTLFTAARGYDGPGVGVGNGVFSIGTYHSWYGPTWDEESEMRAHSDGWVNWFTAHAPNTEYFLYLIDESGATAQTEQWAQWLRNNPGPGRALQSMATIPLPTAVNSTPSLSLPTATLGVGATDTWNAAWQTLQADPQRAPWMYNGQRPAAGTWVTDDDGVALRATAWAQYKKQIPRWFYWESTFYLDQQGCTGRADVFTSARTIGCLGGTDERGEYGYIYTNGDGVLFYPGTDTLYPASSYDLHGPIASLRLKHWRRGIQDVDYLTLAAQKNPAAVNAIVNQMIPKVLWEVGVHTQNDPSYVHTPISWSTDPDDWEAARAQLAKIIEGN